MARILIVDDDINNAEMLAIVISFLGHEPIITFGKQAIAVVSSEHVDFVLLDYLMPELNGIDTLHEIRSLNNTRTLPIYLCSGIQSTIINEKARSQGASGVLQKPISMDKLMKVINETICIIKSG